MGPESLNPTRLDLPSETTTLVRRDVNDRPAHTTGKALDRLDLALLGRHTNERLLHDLVRRQRHGCGNRTSRPYPSRNEASSKTSTSAFTAPAASGRPVIPHLTTHPHTTSVNRSTLLTRRTRASGPPVGREVVDRDRRESLEKRTTPDRTTGARHHAMRPEPAVTVATMRSSTSATCRLPRPGACSSLRSMFGSGRRRAAHPW